MIAWRMPHRTLSIALFLTSLLTPQTGGRGARTRLKELTSARIAHLASVTVRTGVRRAPLLEVAARSADYALRCTSFAAMDPMPAATPSGLLIGSSEFSGCGNDTTRGSIAQ